jgi:hypothetical protein
MSTTRDYEILTPTARARVRRWVYWVVAFTVVLIISVVGLLIKGGAELGQALEATNPGPAGAKALAEVLRQQGVDVTVTSTLADTEDAVTDPATTTLFVYDRDFILDETGNKRIVELADTLVLLDPDYDLLELAAPAVAMAGSVEGTVTADCDVFAATQADEVASDGSGFRVIDDTAEVEGCFPTDGDIYSLVRVEAPERTVSILGTTRALSNEFIAERGNAALALNLLGENESLVWYIPGIGDLLGESAPTLGELSPPWVTPAILLVLLGGITAAVWRGRRFGPLVIENLPVIVRSSETMQGRARLYQSNSTRLHALDALRIGTIARVGAACGLPRTASVDDVIAAVASVTGRDIHSVRSLLIDANPTTDRDLISLSDDLLELERDVAITLKPL